MGRATADPDHTSVLTRLLRGVTGLATRWPVLTILLCFGLAGAASLYSRQSLKFKTSRADLIDPQADYQQRWIRYTESFGEVSDMVVVVEADSPAAIARVLLDLGARVEKEPQHFRNVFYKIDSPALRRKGLQYLSPDQLAEVVEQLDEYGPILKGDRFALLTLSQFIRQLHRRMVETRDAAGEVTPELETQLEPMFDQMARLIGSLDLFLQNRKDFLSPWPDLIPLDPQQQELASRLGPLMNERRTMGFLKAQPVLRENDFAGATPAIARMRQIMADVERGFPGSRIGLTGIPVLENDEMRDSEKSMFDASVLSFFGVTVLTFVGFRGIRHPLIATVLLVVGMAWSFGFATLAVGHLNILSVSFAAMLVGLGMDYGTVYLTRYLELRQHGRELVPALRETASTIGPGTVTGAMTTAVAFFAAVFTDFVGVAELGIIASGGIVLCLVCTFVLLPALVVLIDRNRPSQKLPRPIEGTPWRFVTSRYPTAVVILSGLLVLALIPGGLRMRSDYNLLNMQAEGLPSVEVQKRIFEQAEDGSILFAVSLADSAEQALDLKKKFEALPSVHHVIELASMLPRYPAEDTQLQVQAIHALLSELPTRVVPADSVEPKVIGDELERCHETLDAFASPGAAAARGAINQFLDRLSPLSVEEQVAGLRDYQTAMASDLLVRLHAARDASHPEPVTVNDLPKALASRFISPQGKWLLQVYPKTQIWDMEPLERFIGDVRSVDPEATGTPLQTFEATRSIFHSYQLVGIYALLAVSVLLLIDLQHVGEVLLAMVPPGLGALLTFGILGYAEIPLNPANLIILPLIVGLGVDAGVHVVHDFRRQPRRYRTSASTFNAILLNSITTMIGFGSMMIAAHRGLSSLGMVLTIGVGCCLFVALVILPALLSLVSGQRRRQRRLSESRGAVSLSQPRPAGVSAPSRIQTVAVPAPGRSLPAGYFLD